MSITDQNIRQAPVEGAGEFDEIEAIIGRAREGAMDEDAAFEAIDRIVQRRTAAVRGETYQKPWG